MAWMQKSVASPGQYLYAVTVSGLNVDLFGSVSHLEMVERLRAYVNGASILQVQMRRDILSGEIRVFARADQPIATELFVSQVEAAINSFWTIAGARVNVYVSDALTDNLPAAPGDSTAETVRWIAAAVIVVAVVIAIIQLKKLTT